jgi:HAD superfamily hydrolase (TIGR01509 family)
MSHEQDMRMKYDAVIFDLDGLLLDSERIILETFVEACESFQIKADTSVVLRCIGVNRAKSEAILKAGLGENFPYDEVVSLWLQKHAAKAHQAPIPLKKGAQALLQRIKAAGLPIAVATSSPYDEAMLKLQNAGILDYFEFIVAGDQIQHSKPDPEIYLKVAQRLGVEASRCLALEDSNNGVKAAHAAGMVVVQVPDLVEPSESVKALGHVIVDSLAEVVPYLETSS